MGNYNQWDSVKFNYLEEAIIAMFSIDCGKIFQNPKRTRVILFTKGVVGKQRDTSEDLYFTSETKEAFYEYTIEKHEDFYKLEVYRTYKHGMITAAIVGDLDMFKECFDDRIKMIEFSLAKAIENDQWSIVEYLIDNFDLKNRPIKDSIRFDKVEILKSLLLREFELIYDWLAMCMHHNSINVATEFLCNQKCHLKFPIDEIKTRWFEKQIQKDNELVNLVKRIIPGH